MRVRVDGDTIEQRLEVPCHARDRLAVENIAIVDQLAEQTMGLLSNLETQVELRDTRIEVELLNLKAVDRGIFERIVADLERDLNDRRITQVALRMKRLDHRVEGQILMRIGLERVVAGFSEQLTKSRIARQVAAHREHIHEQANQPLGLDPGPARDRRADYDVVAATVAMQHDLKTGQQRHEQSGALAAGESLQAIGQLP